MKLDILGLDLVHEAVQPPADPLKERNVAPQPWALSYFNSERGHPSAIPGTHHQLGRQNQGQQGAHISRLCFSCRKKQTVATNFFSII